MKHSFIETPGSANTDNGLQWKLVGPKALPAMPGLVPSGQRRGGGSLESADQVRCQAMASSRKAFSLHTYYIFNRICIIQRSSWKSFFGNHGGTSRSLEPRSLQEAQAWGKRR